MQFLQQSDHAQLNNILKDGIEGLEMTEGMQSYVLTVIALQILNTYFSAKNSEWKLIKTKANGWCRMFKGDNSSYKNNIESMEKIVKKFIQDEDAYQLEQLMAI